VLRKAGLTAALAVVSTLTTLAAAEILVRWAGLAPEIFSVQRGRFRISANPLIGYELVPGFESDRSGSMLDFEGKANRLGFRDRDHAVQKPEGAFRIIVLGDSIVQGLGIRDEEDIFTSVLANRLAAKRGRVVEVMNFGTSGYNTQQEVETLREKGLVYSPDLVVLAYCVNDTWLDSGRILALLEEERRSRGVRRAPPRWQRSALLRLVHSRIAALADDAPDPFDAIKSNTVGRALDALADLSLEHGFEVLLVYFPWLDGRAVGPGEPTPAALRANASRRGFHFLDLTRAMARCAGEGPVANDPIHPNAAGHRCVGVAIAEFLEIERGAGR
jgi:lysophospholipase L1-like esterase